MPTYIHTAREQEWLGADDSRRAQIEAAIRGELERALIAYPQVWFGRRMRLVAVVLLFLASVLGMYGLSSALGPTVGVMVGTVGLVGLLSVFESHDGLKANEQLWRAREADLSDTIDMHERTLRFCSQNRGLHTGRGPGHGKKRGVKTTVQVTWADGIHARPAANIGKLANDFAADITLRREGEHLEVSARDIESVLTMAAEHGSRLVIAARGTDAREAVRAMRDLFQRQFDMHYWSPPDAQGVSIHAITGARYHEPIRGA